MCFCINLLGGILLTLCMKRITCINNSSVLKKIEFFLEVEIRLEEHIFLVFGTTHA